VLDYLVKPVEPPRLAETVARLRERLAVAPPAPDLQALLQQLAAQLQPPVALPAPVRWIRAQAGQALRTIAVDDIDYLRADAKYTRVAWHEDGGRAAEALIGTALKDLVAQLDPLQFAQVHCSTVVNLRAILRNRGEVLPVSRSYLHLFRQM
jgi:DNA-binding LytR/AlgR family response regulator